LCDCARTNRYCAPRARTFPLPQLHSLHRTALVRLDSVQRSLHLGKVVTLLPQVDTRGQAPNFSTDRSVAVPRSPSHGPRPANPPRPSCFSGQPGGRNGSGDCEVETGPLRSGQAGGRPGAVAVARFVTSARRPPVLCEKFDCLQR